MGRSYRQFLKLLEHWPADSTKVGRDLGQHIREQVKISFKSGEINIGNEAECNRIYSSLKRIADDHYAQLYLRKSRVSASGLSADECQGILSTEFLEELQKSDKGFFSRFFLVDSKK
ncbi:Ubiquinol-cytochrome-c reductase complex assembly factor 2 [Blattella germanica]|nr:Ubiquinol-cytochrome-c reductase complex assembly factor 2 [Blattella germanica]